MERIRIKAAAIRIHRAIRIRSARRRPARNSAACCLTRNGSFTCAGAAKAAGFRSAISTSDLSYENHTSYPAPGEIILYPGGISETEILLAYGNVLLRQQSRPARGKSFSDDRRRPRSGAAARRVRAVARRPGYFVRGDLAVGALVRKPRRQAVSRPVPQQAPWHGSCLLLRQIHVFWGVWNVYNRNRRTALTARSPIYSSLFVQVWQRLFSVSFWGWQRPTSPYR